MSEAISRRTAIARAAGLAGIAAGGLGAACSGEGPRGTLLPTPSATLDDAAIGRILISAELLAIDFYGRALAVPGFGRAQIGYLSSALANERSHLLAVAITFGVDASARPRFAFPDGTFADPASVTRSGVALEQAFLGAYLGAVSEASEPALGALAARIAANEAQHLQGIAALGAVGPTRAASLARVLTAREAASIVAPFLA